MNCDDFAKLIGADEGPIEFLPVAMLLRSGYACAGYYNSSLNRHFRDTCVLLNARVLAVGLEVTGGRPTLQDFNDFMQEIVSTYSAGASSEMSQVRDAYGKSIPLTALPYSEMTVVYPIAHISELIRRARQVDDDDSGPKLPAFLDLEKSQIIKLLRTRIW